ncbi:MAG: hypothetical protein CSA33_00840 [Desulfobulbus propionicus]|nr:MAG: hypothetical protein CSA33_00840 [Desulfobulbus propionicus]
MEGVEPGFLISSGDASLDICSWNGSLYLLQKDSIMAEMNDSAVSRQVLNDLKGRMLALKEHL